MSKALKSKMIWRCCIHNTFGKTMGPHVTMVTQLIVSWNWRMLQTKVVTNDLKTFGWKRFDTRSVNWTVVQIFLLSAVVQLSECRKRHSFYSPKRKHSDCQWRVEAVAGAVGPAISGSCSTDSTSRKDTANVANILKTTMFNRHINTNHDLQTLHLCTDQELK